ELGQPTLRSGASEPEVRVVEEVARFHDGGLIALPELHPVRSDSRLFGREEVLAKVRHFGTLEVDEHRAVAVRGTRTQERALYGDLGLHSRRLEGHPSE